MGNVIEEDIRSVNVPGRYGGEFLVVLPQSDINGAHLVAVRIKRGLRSLSVIRIMNNLLYKAKKQEKDRIELELS